MDALADAVEVVPDRLYFIAADHRFIDTPNTHYHWIDSRFTYHHGPDFGPLSLGQTISFCRDLERVLASGSHAEQVIYVCSGRSSHSRTIGAYLICAFNILIKNRSAEESYIPFLGIFPPLQAFRERSHDTFPFATTVLHCCRALERAVACGFLRAHDFDLELYTYFSASCNGAISWLVPDRVLALPGPLEQPRALPGGGLSLCVQDYVPLFRSSGVTTVVRLNTPNYDKDIFQRGGVEVVDCLVSPDGALPSPAALRRFLRLCQRALEAPPLAPSQAGERQLTGASTQVQAQEGEQEREREREQGRVSTSAAIAVHCKDGLASTSSLVAAYLMKYHQFTALEAIVWLRICRPGSVPGPHQQYLLDLQPAMHRAGHAFRARARRALRKRQAAAAEARRAVQRSVEASLAGTLAAPGGSKAALYGGAEQWNTLSLASKVMPLSAQPRFVGPNKVVVSEAPPPRRRHRTHTPQDMGKEEVRAILEAAKERARAKVAEDNARADAEAVAEAEAEAAAAAEAEAAMGGGADGGDDSSSTTGSVVSTVTATTATGSSYTSSSVSGSVSGSGSGSGSSSSSGDPAERRQWEGGGRARAARTMLDEQRAEAQRQRQRRSSKAHRGGRLVKAAAANAAAGRAVGGGAQQQGGRLRLMDVVSTATSLVGAAVGSGGQPGLTNSSAVSANTGTAAPPHHQQPPLPPPQLLQPPPAVPS